MKLICPGMQTVGVPAFVAVILSMMVCACNDDGDATINGCARQNVTVSLVSHQRLDGPNADVWAHGDFAYVGTWANTLPGVPADNCTGIGVKIVDVSTPAQATMIGTLADHPFTSAEDVMVISLSNSHFSGDLLAVGLQSCELPDTPGMRGVELWDVTDPRSPKQLSFFDVAPSHGVHELHLFRRGDRAFVLLAVPLSEVFDPNHLGDFRVVEVTNPRSPVELADWGAGKDGGVAFGSPLLADFGPPYDGPPYDCTPPAGGEPVCRGEDFPVSFGHSVSANDTGTRAYVSYEDAGMFIFDISEPSHPVLLGRAVEPQSDEGNLHSTISIPGDRFAVTTDEDSTPGPFGAARIWNISDPHSPVQIATFATPNSLSTRTDGDFTVHNPEVHGNLLYLSWYSDGVRIVDISQPGAPREAAAFVPPEADVWGVHVQGDLIFLSDIENGLYILKQEISCARS